MNEVIIADDHRMFVVALQKMLEEHGLSVVAVSFDRESFFQACLEFPEAIAIADLHMPGNPLAEVLPLLRSEAPGIRVLVLTGDSDLGAARQLIDAGIAGFTLKEYAFEEILHALRTIDAGERYFSPKVMQHLLSSQSPILTDRQMQILRFVASGLTSKSIASRLSLHVKTIDNHRQHIMEKLGVRSAVEMVRVAKERSLI